MTFKFVSIATIVFKRQKMDIGHFDLILEDFSFKNLQNPDYLSPSQEQRDR